MTRDSKKASEALVDALRKEQKAVFVVIWDTRPMLERSINEQRVGIEVLCSETNNQQIVKQMFMELSKMVTGSPDDPAN